jgi:GT2 family glycosyltransferase
MSAPAPGRHPTGHGVAPEGAAPDLSIVIATRNRASQLAKTLESFREIRTARQWELIVVDNASRDDTPGVMERDWIAAPFTRLRIDAAGLCRAQNTAIRHARASIIAFTDDDCYPQHDFVDRLLDAFIDPRVAFVGGRVLLHDPTDLPITIQTRETSMELPPGTPIDAGFIHGANLAFRKDALEQLGGFDERLGPGASCGSCGDWDIMCRALAAGYAGRYDPGPTVRHHHGRRTLAQVRALERRYAFGRGAIYMKAFLTGGAYAGNLRWLRRDVRETIRAPRRDLRNVRARGRELMGAIRFLIAQSFERSSA